MPRASSSDNAEVTTGREVATTGGALLLFGVGGLLYVRFALPKLNHSVGLPAWHEGRWAKRWNYGLPLVLCVIGAVVTVIGLVAWAAGWPFE